MFNNLFGNPSTIKEQQRDNDRSLRKASRDIERERRKLEDEEKKLEHEIRKNAAQGKNDICRILAKQLVQIRKQKERTFAANSKITSIGYQNKTIGTNVALTNAMGTTAKTMAEMNKILKPEGITANVRQFQQANMKMEMTDEMINDTLDDMLTESGDEEGSNAVVSQVLDEIGIEVFGRMHNLPETGGDLHAEDTRTDKDIINQLAKLRSS